MTAVIWIDWYAYHVSRLRALAEHESFQGSVTGIELVGGCGVHEGLKFRDEDRAGLPISSLFPTADWQKMGQLRLACALWRKLDELRPSTVLVPGLYTVPGFAAALWAKLHGKRSVLMSETTYGDWARVWWKEFAKSVLTKAMFDYGIAGGKPHVRYLRHLGLSAERIGQCYDVVDNHFYEEAAGHARRRPELREALGLPQDYFVYVGRLAPEKNVSTLLYAYAAYVKRGGTWELVLIGDGPERARLETQCATLGIANSVRFCGLKKTREIPPYYAFAKCFVLPSLREPWGLVANEAMASSLPVIISERCGCAEDLVEPGVNGYLFDPENQGELTDRLLAMSTQGASAAAAMGRRSGEIIQGYSPERWADEVARIVQTAS
jgi:1,2-diacylglycerol 3-alpha-glucosyltransferase